MQTEHLAFKYERNEYESVELWNFSSSPMKKPFSLVFAGGLNFQEVNSGNPVPCGWE